MWNTKIHSWNGLTRVLPHELNIPHFTFTEGGIRAVWARSERPGLRWGCGGVRMRRATGDAGRCGSNHVQRVLYAD